MGSDQPPQRGYAAQSGISIHAPRMGSDRLTVKDYFATVRFQSTLPAWGATTNACSLSFIPANFNPRSPHGERRRVSVGVCDRSTFQSTLPAWGATVACIVKSRRSGYFNPRSPHGERRATGMHPFSAMRISIHAPRMGSDRRRGAARIAGNISIHAPRMGSDPF